MQCSFYGGILTLDFSPEMKWKWNERRGWEERKGTQTTRGRLAGAQRNATQRNARLRNTGIACIHQSIDRGVNLCVLLFLGLADWVAFVHMASYGQAIFLLSRGS